jgi:hypothetical protein
MIQRMEKKLNMSTIEDPQTIELVSIEQEKEAF